MPIEPPLISADSIKQADELFRQAHLDHLAGRAKEAESGYRSALAANPRHAESLHFLGVLALQFGHLQMATQLMAQSVEISPTFASLNNLGEALRQAGRIDEAIALFQRGLQIKPDHVDAMANLGVAMTQKRQLDQAESWFRRALSINPRHIGALAGLALLLDQRSQSLPLGNPNVVNRSVVNDDAIAMWDRLVRLAPKHFAYRRSMGDALLRGDDFYRAASAYRQAIEIDPTDAETHAKLAHSLSMANKFDEALAEAQKSIDLSPNRWEGYRERGRVLERAERTTEAVAAYREALLRHPGNSMLHADIGRMLTDLGDDAAALDYFQKGQILEPTNFRFSLSQSKLFYQLERYPESLAAAREAVRLAPHDADAHSGLAFALLVLGQFDEGFAEYEWRWRAATVYHRAA